MFLLNLIEKGLFYFGLVVLNCSCATEMVPVLKSSVNLLNSVGMLRV